jgi:cellulose synthase/poly-beta-1,6-N-acetylglucosamine synthase-like glycosyltransferase
MGQWESLKDFRKLGHDKGRGRKCKLEVRSMRGGVDTEGLKAKNAARVRSGADNGIEVSVVIPCLNEANSIGICVTKAIEAFRAAGLRGEVIVADNGSTDGSIETAEKLGARVVRVEARGYGSALRAGIAAARGAFIVMGDADDSYDFGDVPRFVATGE